MRLVVYTLPLSKLGCIYGTPVPFLMQIATSLAMVVETAWREIELAYDGSGGESSLRWALISHGYRFCDARLNPYPCRPYHDHPRRPGGFVC